jgi:hypothetical protein
MIAATWGTGQVLLDILWFFLLFIEVWLIISIFVDIFQRHDMKGWLKALWVLLVIVFPLVGIVAYLIIYGDEMKVHARQAAQEQDRAFQDYVRQAVGATSPADELTRLAALRDKGTITEEEFQRLKSRVIDGHSATTRSS